MCAPHENPFLRDRDRYIDQSPDPEPLPAPRPELELNLPLVQQGQRDQQDRPDQHTVLNAVIRDTIDYTAVDTAVDNGVPEAVNNVMANGTHVDPAGAQAAIRFQDNSVNNSNSDSDSDSDSDDNHSSIPTIVANASDNHNSNTNNYTFNSHATPTTATDTYSASNGRNNFFSSTGTGTGTGTTSASTSTATTTTNTTTTITTTTTTTTTAANSGNSVSALNSATPSIPFAHPTNSDLVGDYTSEFGVLFARQLAKLRELRDSILGPDGRLGEPPDSEPLWKPRGVPRTRYVGQLEQYGPPSESPSESPPMVLQGMGSVQGEGSPPVSQSCQSTEKEPRIPPSQSSKQHAQSAEWARGTLVAVNRHHDSRLSLPRAKFHQTSGNNLRASAEPTWFNAPAAAPQTAQAGGLRSGSSAAAAAAPSTEIWLRPRPGINPWWARSSTRILESRTFLTGGGPGQAFGQTRPIGSLYFPPMRCPHRRDALERSHDPERVDYPTMFSRWTRKFTIVPSDEPVPGPTISDLMGSVAIPASLQPEEQPETPQHEPQPVLQRLPQQLQQQLQPQEDVFISDNTNDNRNRNINGNIGSNENNSNSSSESNESSHSNNSSSYSNDNNDRSSSSSSSSNISDSEDQEAIADEIIVRTAASRSSRRLAGRLPEFGDMPDERRSSRRTSNRAAASRPRGISKPPPRQSPRAPRK